MKWLLYLVFVLAGVLPLRAGHTLRGTVANASGKAVEAATVQIMDRSSSGSSSLTSLTKSTPRRSTSGTSVTTCD